MRMLAPSLVRSWREQIMQGADELVAELVARGNFDAAVELSEHFVLNVIGDIVGLPQEGREHMLAYGNMAMNTSGPRNETYIESIAQAADSIGWVETACRRDAVAAGGVGRAGLRRGRCRRYPRRAMGEVFVRLFPTAAVDTTSSTIANAIHNLASNPDQWRLLREDPSLARNAFQETIRFTQAIHPLYRTTNSRAGSPARRSRRGRR